MGIRNTSEKKHSFRFNLGFSSLSVQTVVYFFFQKIYRVTNVFRYCSRFQVYKNKQKKNYPAIKYTMLCTSCFKEGSMAKTRVAGKVADRKGKEVMKKKKDCVEALDHWKDFDFYSELYGVGHWKVLVVEWHCFTYILSVSPWLLCGCQPAK